jgi:hypothetical protein
MDFDHRLLWCSPQVADFIHILLKVASTSAGNASKPLDLRRWADNAGATPAHWQHDADRRKTSHFAADSSLASKPSMRCVPPRCQRRSALFMTATGIKRDWKLRAE